MIFEPRILFSLLWIFELIGHVYIHGIFENLASETIRLVLISIVSFCVGSFIVEKVALFDTGREKINIIKANKRYSFKYAFILMTLYLIIELLLFKNILDRMHFNAFEISKYNILRQLLVNDFATSKNFSMLLKVLFCGVGISLYFISESDDGNTIGLSLMFGLVSALLTTGRLALLMYVIGVSYLLYNKKIIKMSGLMLMGSLFMILFLIIAVIFKKGNSVGNLFEQVIWNLNVYFFSGLAAFNHYVGQGDPSIDGGAFIPNILRIILNPLFGPFKTRPSINPFIFIPIPTNVYTALFPIYHDFKTYGLILYTLFLGMGHEFLYIKRHSTIIAGEYYFALSLYPLVMTIFEEAYFSSLGTWFLLLIIPTVMVLLKSVIEAMANIIKSNQ